VTVGGTPSLEAALWGLAAGLVGGSALPLAYAAFRIGLVGPVSAAVASSSTIVVTAWALSTGAAITVGRFIALVLCLISIALVTRRPRDQAMSVSGRGILLGVLAGVGFESLRAHQQNRPP
jgi:hypothetical protein